MDRRSNAVGKVALALVAYAVLWALFAAFMPVNTAEMVGLSVLFGFSIYGGLCQMLGIGIQLAVPAAGVAVAAVLLWSGAMAARAVARGDALTFAIKGASCVTIGGVLAAAWIGIRTFIAHAH
ncbi:hypothetical protein [uncultured Sphingomonas sp.]|uniref:hypothetical protein n=1 Tax=uncultured Sphingomonas sp. TaxID=158754 RepID=UPI00260F582F|nr:hypothetical protein [uncultured Sphingomonas sp.]